MAAKWRLSLQSLPIARIWNLYERVIAAVLVNITEADPHTAGNVVVPDFQFAVLLVL